MRALKNVHVGLAGLLSIGLLVVSLGCEGSFTFDFGILGGEASDEFTLNESIAGIETLRVTTDIGRISITTNGSLTEAEINVSVEVRAARDDDAEDILDGITINVQPLSGAPSVLVVEANVPTEGIILVDFTIVLPAGLDLDLTTDTGTVQVAGNEGAVDIETDTGSVEVSDNTGDVQVLTDTGRIDLIQVTGNVDVRSSTGAISVTAVIPTDGTIDVETGTGSIAIEVPIGTDTELDLETDFGIVEVDLRDFVVTDLRTGISAVSATLNDGGGLIRARADFGSIEFSGF